MLHKGSPAPAQCGLGGSVHQNWPWARQPFLASIPPPGTSDPIGVLLGNSLEVSETWAVQQPPN